VLLKPWQLTDQGITTLKLAGHNKIPIYPADWIAGVEYEGNENKNDDETYKIEIPNYAYDEELNDEEAFDRIDQEEIGDLLAESENQYNQNENGNPFIQEENVNVIKPAQPENPVTDDEEDTTGRMEMSRPTRERSQPDRLKLFSHKRNKMKNGITLNNAIN
jgi:hypothetical protein